MAAERAPRVCARGITKSFPGVRALTDVDLTIRAGEVLAVVGENGAGKSTLMKILAGVQEPDSGTIEVDGRGVRLDSVGTAIGHGIALIHQELNLCDNLSVAANVFLGREPGAKLWIDERRLLAGARAILARVGLDIDPRRPLAGLSIGQQQIVEVAKALAVDARVLIMDEPTSSLSAAEADRLFAVIGDLERSGTSIVYISHRLGEVERLANRVVVLRDGRRVGELGRDAISYDAIVDLMVGEELDTFYERTAHVPGAEVLEVRDLVTAASPGCAAALTVRAGEVVGLAGLVGAGRSELLRAIFGVDAARQGTVRVGGAELALGDSRAAVRAGVGFVPEDRKAEGLVLDLSVGDNVVLASCDRVSRAGFVDAAAAHRLAERAIADLAIKTPSAAQVTRFLSGGNQQKVVLGKWLAREPRVLLLDEPTRGIDVRAKREVYELIDRLAGQGLGVLFASSELDELFGVADRILVMYRGAIVGDVARDRFDRVRLLRLMTGSAA